MNSNFFFEENPHIGLCVSGGPDSVALMLLMKKWNELSKGEIFVFHFNHNLREESKSEAAFILDICKNMKIECNIINWKSEKPKSGILAAARASRYESIINLCKEKKILHLMTAHHHDDRLETFVMRSTRKFSSLGLSSIPQTHTHNHLQILRPLLNFRKERLVATCKRFKVNWINDPSNKDERYERTRIRNKLKNYDIRKLKDLSNELKKIILKNSKTEKKICEFISKSVRFYDYGLFEIKKKNILNLSNDISVEIFKKLLTTCSGKVFPPRKKSILIFLKKFEKRRSFVHTLHSCYMSSDKRTLRIYREPSKTRKNIINKILVKKGEKMIWDERFKIYSKKNDLICDVITEKNWLEIKKKYDKEKSHKFSFSIIKTLPIISIGKEKIIPFLSINNELKEYGVDFLFSPSIPVTKKNFFKY